MTDQPNPNRVLNPKYLILGEVLRPHGIRGELRVKLMTDYPERINQLKQVYIGKSPDAETVLPYSVKHMRMNPPYGLLKLEGIDDRDAAERFRQLYVMVDMENAVPLEEGEFYLYQLIGLTVQTTAGEVIGTLTDLMETGANDVYIVTSPKYGSVVIPAIPQVVIKTDVAAGIMTIEPMEGLLPSPKGDADNDRDS